MTSRVAALLLVAAICFSCAAAQTLSDCCLSFADKPFDRRYRIKSYEIQDAGKGCNIDATVFLTKSNQRLCTPHPSKSTWVFDVIAALETKRGRH